MEEKVLENKKLCECGCGSIIPTINKKRQKARFKHGHNSRILIGSKSPFWKGGKRLTRYGYTEVWISPHRFVLEHRLVMEQYLGRKLESWEDVHHINGIKTDNRIENLQLMNHKEHSSYTALTSWNTGKLSRDKMDWVEMQRLSWVSRKR
jgi:HNH endonuclease